MENDCGIKNSFFFFLVEPTVPSEEKDIIGYIVGPLVAGVLVIAIAIVGCWYVYQSL